MTALKTTTNVTFTGIATILIPVGVGLFATNLTSALIVIGLGIVALVLREVLKSI